jgi:hypothetical protein
MLRTMATIERVLAGDIEPTSLGAGIRLSPRADWPAYWLGYGS